jgi:tyrosyl-tRNA synthetase
MKTPVKPADFDTHLWENVLEQHAVLSRGTAQIIPEADKHGLDGLHYKLMDALKTGRPLKVKFGMDPTAPDLHLGHTVPMTGLRRFQDLGHIAQPLIGDYTARIGDPSGRNKTRPPLSGEDIDRNAQTYLEQLYKILDNDGSKVELLYNGQWLKELSFADTIKLCAQATVAQIIAREDFAKRLAENTPVSMHELLYPLMQGYDSVAMGCDIEFGGTDQTFNCLMGRQLMAARGMEPQIVMTFPLLEGLDGVEKMSKSKGNYIGVTDAPADMYGKVMSITDAMLGKWYDLLTSVAPEDRDANPYAAKHALARMITARFHGEAAADKAKDDFMTRFSKREIPDELPEATVAHDVPLAQVLVQVGFAASTSEARRLISQNAVKLEGAVLADPAAPLPSAGVLQAGKRHMAKVSLS